MNRAGKRAERKLTEPTGIEFSLTSVDSLCCPSRQALAKTACPGATAGQYASSRHLSTVCESTWASTQYPAGRMAERGVPGHWKPRILAPGCR